MKTVLAPVDFSAVTNSVLAAAESLAAAMKGRLFVLNVMPIPQSIATCQLGAEETEQLLTETEKDAKEQLDSLVHGIAAIPVEVVTARGFAADEIVREAILRGADYIVMGSHGHTALFEFLVGGTTRSVLRSAACPVVIVPAPKHGAKPQKTELQTAEAAKVG